MRLTAHDAGNAHDNYCDEKDEKAVQQGQGQSHRMELVVVNGMPASRSRY